MITLKNYILYLFLFQFTLYSQVTVKTNELKADNKSITDNTIAFNSNLAINVSLNVHLETSNGSVDNTFGNLYVYYKKNETDIPMQVGFHSVTFYLKTYYTSDILFNTVTLHKNEFYNTGGILYAEYKNNKNQTYQSTKIAVTGGSLATAPPTPTNQKIVTQNLKYSDDIPIINSKIFVPNNTSTLFDLEIYKSQSEGQTSAVNIYAYEEFGKKEILLKSTAIGGYFDSYFLIKNIKINYDALDFAKYTCKLRIEVRNYSKDLSTYQPYTDILSQNKQDITIILTKPILSNNISDNQSLTIGEAVKPFTSDSPYVDFTIPCNYRGCNITSDYRYITTFKWQTRSEAGNWSDIPNANNKDFSPNSVFSENVYYRRIAIYNGENFSISNTISITKNDQSLQNAICCNQTLPLSTSQPQEITGSVPTLENFTYQWQICTNLQNNSLNWIDLPNGKSQNYKHTFTEPAGRWTGETSFRRLIIKNSIIINTSNSITISRGRSSLASSKPLNNIEPTEETPSNNIVSTYPNPINNLFYIEGATDINNVVIYDSFGQKIDIDKHQKSDNLIEVNTSKIQPGIYILKTDNTSFSKTLIKN